jgi:hypothetical protein
MEHESGFTTMTLDGQLHVERLEHPLLTSNFLQLPDGASIFDPHGDPRIVWNRQLLKWYFNGYSNPFEAQSEPIRVEYPATTLKVLAAGYPLQVHPSLTK